MFPSNRARLAGLGPTSPVDIPEILDRVLSFLNKRTLAHSALLVSRQWYSIARQYLVLEFAWSDCLEKSEGLEHALRFLPQMTRLQWFAGSPREAAGVMAQERHWAVLLRALETVDYNKTILETKYEPFDLQHYNKLMIHLPPNLARHRPTASTVLQTPKNQTPGQPRTGLCEFELHGDVLMKRFRLLLPLLSSLTRLVLKTSHGKCSETMSWNETINIRTILLYCPYLEDLHITAGRQESLPGPWHPHVYWSLLAFPIPPLPLRSLVLEQGVAQQKDLEDLLASTPRLKSLRCIALDLLGEDKTSVEQFDMNRFHVRLLSLNIRLDSFFVSTLDIKSLDTVCPTPQERTFYDTDLTLHHMQYLQHQSNNITSLELRGRFDVECTPNSLLHDYLCSSPHLLHLKALALPYPLEHMDLHGLLPPTALPSKGDHSTSIVYPPGVWQCRKLRTLHIRIATPKNAAGDRPAPLPQHSRIAFGYIARICPELRDIELSNGGPRAKDPYLDLSVLGGLCLLGRLQHLGRFSSGTWKKQGVLSARNLEWIIESGRSEDKTRRRQKYLQSIWKTFGLLDNAGVAPPFDDAATIAKRNLDSLASKEPQQCFDWTGVDSTLREELQYLGLPVEVKAFFDALDKQRTQDGNTGYHCFPVLRFLSFCSPGGIELSPEQEIKRVVTDKTRRLWIR
ncbi:hypothetical protein BGW39_002496 [Mortierella sp. 14UC]|nr:hypothetical protein BGW39_002496 [Mortierella sp. 14UC]